VLLSLLPPAVTDTLSHVRGEFDSVQDAIKDWNSQLSFIQLVDTDGR
jgi:hypothetical protein